MGEMDACMSSGGLQETTEMTLLQKAIGWAYGFAVGIEIIGTQQNFTNCEYAVRAFYYDTMTFYENATAGQINEWSELVLNTTYILTYVHPLATSCYRGYGDSIWRIQSIISGIQDIIQDYSFIYQNVLVNSGLLADNQIDLFTQACHFATPCGGLLIGNTARLIFFTKPVWWDFWHKAEEDPVPVPPPTGTESN
jgi:hypothetical protein